MDKVLSIDKLKEAALSEKVRLPGWNIDYFIARLRRPSILNLAAKGRIPNQLLGAATEIFNTGKAEKVSLKEMESIMKIMAEEALVDPTFEELAEAGIELTDQQYMAIFNYTQIGIKALIPFLYSQSKC